MQIIADLHTHSRFSRAVSQKMDLNEISNWSAKKGINLVSTGDWTHPLWFREISSQLEETQPGIYKLKNADGKHEVLFLLSTEISSIYSQGGKVRRIHALLFSPSLEASDKFNKELKKRGANLMADGRPIVGIPAKDLLQIALTTDPNFLFIPAHAWTPWFSLYGSNSGFDSIDECFEDQSKYIFAIETGLSSDPLMNWQIKDLYQKSILSFSDAHSSPKLGREATVFVKQKQNDKFSITNFQYKDIVNAVKQDPDGKLKIGYTIEFFPEEGKYHWSGHRNCNIRYSPQAVKEKGMTCPVCSRKLTIGVENRVLQLSHKSLPEDDNFVKNSSGAFLVYDKERKRVPFVSLVPLLEILLELSGSPTKALANYESLVSSLGTEFDILLKKSYEEIGSNAGKELMQAIQIVRERKVFVDPGYDGVFGKVKIFQDNEKNQTEEKENQLGLF